MESQTGVSGQLVPSGDAESMGQELIAEKLHLGVFHGLEFAWARQKFPELQPLVIAVNQRPHLHALVLVRTDSPIKEFGDLKGKTLALPRQTREHCRHFVQRRSQDDGGPQQFFARITTPANVEEALDDVVDQIVQATVVDGVSLECYQRRKPGRFAKLKIVQQSEVFPAAVVAYRPGALAEATLHRFRQGMLNANQTLLGRQLLTLWKLTGFQPVPADYEQILTEIVKAYPAPAKDVK
jgi:ABC-type phosphate/phosphonate transport system substrate-binding protein